MSAIAATAVVSDGSDADTTVAPIASIAASRYATPSLVPRTVPMMSEERSE
jgi:hypothetical protein